MNTHTPIWCPTREQIEKSALSAFSKLLVERGLLKNCDFNSIYDLSISDSESFWRSFWEFSKIKASNPPSRFVPAGPMFPRKSWGEGAKLNYAENLLRRDDSSPAVIFWGEGKIRSELSFKELRKTVASVTSAFRSWGIKPGDRVAALMPNIPETVISMLAASACGAIFSSCSPDFGVPGILERFAQIEPKILVAARGYLFKGDVQNVEEKISAVADALPSLKHLVIVDYPEGGKTFLTKAASVHHFGELLKNSYSDLSFDQLPFDHPLFIMFSSGTTGKPKCIVHGAGGTLLEHLKELILHTDISSSDRVFYQTTCGWMMWNWMVSALATGATLVLYDGSPLEKNGEILFDLAQKESVSVFGTNAKFLSIVQKLGAKPKLSHKLPALRTILSTGSPLSAESFDYVYGDIKEDLCLSSISGGTDILGCFALGSPILPVYRGELQCRSLGLAVQVLNDDGKSVVGEKGELTCAAPFPSMPIEFWNDPGDKKYRASYFEKHPDVWSHGDWVELTPRGTMIFYGRSDATLKANGVRIGTAEIYKVVEAIPEIEEAIAVGQEWENDTRVVLFVKLKSGVLTDELKRKIKSALKNDASPHHVPKKIIAVPEIPRTRSGKIVELAVRETIHGRPVKNLEALLNPEALEYFKNIPELKE